ANNCLASTQTQVGANRSVYVSSNEAADFSATALGGVSVQALAVDPTNAQIVYAGAAKGVWKTENGGASWTRVYAGLLPSLVLNVVALAIDPNVPCTIYAGLETFSTTVDTNAVLIRS